MDADWGDSAFSEHYEGNSLRKSTVITHLYKPLMSLVPFGGRKKRSLKRGNVVGLSDASYKWSGRYDRLYNEMRTGRKSLRRKRPKTVRLRSSNKRFSWRFRIFRLRFKWISPVLLLKRLRDAYVQMMIRIANSDALITLSKAYIA